MHLNPKKALIAVTVTLIVLVIGYISFPYILPILVVLGALILIPFMPSPDASLYGDFVKQASATQDIVIQRDCSDISLRVTQTDTAIRGVKPGLGYNGSPPILADVYMLEGLKAGERIFSTSFSPNGRALPEEYKGTVMWAHDLPFKFSVANVTNAGEHERMLKEHAYYRGARTLLFPNTLGIPSETIKEFADCYSKNLEELNGASRMNIASFVTP